MKIRVICMLATLALLCMGTTWGDNKDKKDVDVEKALSKIAQLGPGVHAVKRDAKGRITSCLVVGQARISTVLGNAAGLQNARDKARLDASGQFVKWLKEKVGVYEKNESETILFLEGSEDNDQGALKESGKTVEKTSKRFESISAGQVRGLQVLHLEISDKDKAYTLVMGWHPANAKAAENAEPGNLKGQGTNKKGNKKIEDKNITSDDAKKFIP